MRFILTKENTAKFFNKERFGESLLHEVGQTIKVLVLNGTKEDIKCLFEKLLKQKYNIQFSYNTPLWQEIAQEMNFKELSTPGLLPGESFKYYFKEAK